MKHWGVQPHFSHGKKVYGKRGKNIHFPLFQYTFFPIFSHGKKWENTNFSHGKNAIGPPPPSFGYNKHIKLIKTRNIGLIKLKTQKISHMLNDLLCTWLTNDNSHLNTTYTSPME